MSKKQWILLVVAIVIMNIIFKVYAEISKDYIRNRPAIEAKQER